MTARSRPVLAVAAALAVFIAGAVPAVASAPRTGKWSGKVTKGEVGKGRKGTPTFKVASGGKLMKRFKIPEVAGYCFTGAEAITIAVPKAKIKHRRVDESYVITNNPPSAKPTIHLTGTFSSAKKFKGEVTGEHYCDYDVKFTAKPK